MSQINRDCGDTIHTNGVHEASAQVWSTSVPEDKTLLISTARGAVFLSLEEMKEIIEWAEKKGG